MGLRPAAAVNAVLEINLFCVTDDRLLARCQHPQLYVSKISHIQTNRGQKTLLVAEVIRQVRDACDDVKGPVHNFDPPGGRAEVGLLSSSDPKDSVMYPCLPTLLKAALCKGHIASIEKLKIHIYVYIQVCIYSYKCFWHFVRSLEHGTHCI